MLHSQRDQSGAFAGGRQWGAAKNGRRGVSSQLRRRRDCFIQSFEKFRVAEGGAMTQVDTGGPAAKQAERPLSPHLTVYRPMLTMMMSIAHRITGAALYGGALLLALYLLGLAFGPGAFAAVSWIASGFIGNAILFLFTWALFHHFLGGVRHAIWDRGLYMDPKGREWLAQGTLAGGLGLTLLFWIASALIR
jgi:succinate dehydrogenase / fumarate reductase, cytochrome b subunit